jgi:transposase
VPISAIAPPIMLDSGHAPCAACAHARLESAPAGTAAGSTSLSPSPTGDAAVVIVPLLISAILLHEARPTRATDHAKSTKFRTDPRGEYGTEWAAICSIAQKCGMTAETLRKWVRQVEVDGGRRPGVSSEEAQRIKELERENKELRRANEILKAASAFFARELDPQPRR